MKKKQNLCLLLSCIAFCFTLLVFSPGEFLASHQSDFWFGWSNVGLCFIAAFAAGLLAFYACGRFVFRSSLIYSAVLIALSLLSYIQGNYINPDYGLLDGSSINWNDFKTYGIFNTVLWVGILVIAIVIAIKKPRFMVSLVKAVCLFLVGVQTLTLTVVGVNSMNQYKNPENGYYVLSTDGMFNFSTDSNVIVFLADAFDTDFFTKLMMNKPELFNNWDGFVYYPDFAGSFSKTCSSVPYILTGIPYENNMTLEEYDQTICSDVPFLNTLTENEYDIGIYTSRTNFNCASQMDTISNLRRADSLQAENLPLLLKDYYKLSTFRYAPHLLKPYLVTDTATFSKYQGTDNIDIEIYKNNDNFVFLDYLDHTDITTDNEKKTFRFYHVTGAHSPITMDENLNPVEENSITAFQQSEGVVKYFSVFLGQLKDIGIYDQATIIFTADHGNAHEGVIFPVFALKLPGQTGAISTSSLPLWQKDIRNIILNAEGIEPLGDNLADPLNSVEVNTRIRIFHRYSGDQADRLPDLYLYEIKPGPIPVDTGIIIRTDGTIETHDRPPAIQVGSHLTCNELLPYAIGLDLDHWTVGGYTALAIPLENVEQDIDVTIKLYLWNDYTGNVFVSTPHRFIGEFVRESCETDGSLEIRFTVPYEDLENQVLYLRLAYPSLPFELKPSGDQRRLGLHITAVDIQ